VAFCVTKGILQHFAVPKSCFDLSSYDSPVFITLKAHALNLEEQPSLSNRHTNWDDFRCLINERQRLLKFSLKPKKTLKQQSRSSTIGWNATPGHTETLKAYVKTPLSESASELYRPSDRGLSAKWLPNSRFSRQEPLLFYQVAFQLYSRGWVDPVPDALLFFFFFPQKIRWCRESNPGLRICSQELWPLDHRGGRTQGIWLPYINYANNWRKKEDSVETGADYEHPKAKYYLTQLYRNSKNSLITKIMTASQHSCKVLHQENPLTIPCGRRPKH
jgi:hypothetical protein